MRIGALLVAGLLAFTPEAAQARRRATPHHPGPHDRGKRDPFMTAHLGGTTPIQQWPVDQFSLKGTVTGTASPSAVLLAPDSRAWLVRIGDYVGNNWGKVTSIERDQIVVTETIGGPQGYLYPQPIKLSLASPGSPEHQDHGSDVPPPMSRR